MHISQKIIGLLIFTSMMGVGYLVGTVSPDESPAAAVSPLDRPGPDVKVIVSSSITSMQKQSQLLVLTSRMNATATTTVHEMGMEGWQIDVASGEAQYFVDLKQMNSKNVLVDSNEIVITLPKTSLIIKQLPPVSIESKDNDSWLFTWRPQAKEKLTQYNKQKIIKSFIEQSQEQKDTAYTQAKVALEDIFKTMFKSAALPHTVTVVFQ